ncbi:MAG: hypothetical protein C0625_10925 [Arcobacter sp.]|nr:MAG: hypothetical protein C0625_10925 [Arcobacter sp.]
MKNVVKIIATFVLLLGTFSQVNADELFVFQDAQLKADNGKSAKIFLGVPVKVKKDMDTSAKVSVYGFLDGENVYSTKNKELLIATLDKGFKTKTIKGNEVELVGTIEKELLTENGAEVWEEHEEFFYEMCTQCHAAQAPSHHTMIEWEALMLPMKGFAKLDDEENSYLLRYLKSNASNGLVKTKH